MTNPTLQPGLDPRAQAKADKAYAKAVRPWYKKKRTWLGAAILLLIIPAIVNGGNSGSTTAAPAAAGSAPAAASAPTAAPTPAAAPAAYKVGDAVTIRDVAQTVNSAAKFNSKSEYTRPEDGKVFYVINITIVNQGDSASSFNPYDYKIEDANGVQTSYSWQASSAGVKGDMSSGSLAPGGKLTANLMFEVPADMKSLKLVMEPSFWSNEQVKVTLT